MPEDTITTSETIDAYKVNSLTGLDKADPMAGKLVWDAPRSIWNNLMFLLAVILGPIYYSHHMLLVFAVLATITLCGGHSVGFHRLLIHRSFKCSKWFENILAWLGTVVGMGGPLWTMRFHDTRDWAQRQTDCHAYLRHQRGMLVDGFLYLNFRLQLDNPPGFDPGPRMRADKYLAFLDRYWMWQQLPLALMLYWLGGMPWLVWGVCVRVAACTSMHWMISYFAHTRGPNDWTVDGAIIQAHNVPILAIPTMGEAWHGNHHAFPSSARHGLYPGQTDPGWYFLCLLEKLGLAWELKLPKDLPPRKGITPLTKRALSIASPEQAALCAKTED